MSAAVGSRPSLCDVEQHGPGEVRRRCHRQCARIARLHRPGAVVEERGAVDGPTGRNVRDGRRDEGTVGRRWRGESEVNRLAGHPRGRRRRVVKNRACPCILRKLPARGAVIP